MHSLAAEGDFDQSWMTREWTLRFKPIAFISVDVDNPRGAGGKVAGYELRVELSIADDPPFATERLHFTKGAYDSVSEENFWEQIRLLLGETLKKTYRVRTGNKPVTIDNFSSPGQRRAYERARSEEQPVRRRPR